MSHSGTWKQLLLCCTLFQCSCAWLCCDLERYLPFLPNLSCVSYFTSSTAAQGSGGSFKNRKPIGEVGCCESGMAERSHWWTERCLRSPLFLSLSLFFSLFLYLSLISTYLPTDLSVYLSICLSVYLSPYLSIYLSLSLSSVYLSNCLPVYLSIYLSVCLSVYLSICGAVSFSVM